MAIGAATMPRGAPDQAYKEPATHESDGTKGGLAHRMANRVTDAVKHRAENVAHASPGNARLALVGTRCAAGGLLGAWRSREFRHSATELFKLMFKHMAWIYASILVPAAIFWPVTMPIAFFAPGAVASLLTMVPLWAFNAAQAENKRAFNKLFLGELTRIDPSTAEEMRAKIDAGSGPDTSLYTRLRRSSHFAMQSAALNAIGLVPFLAPLTTAGQLALTSEKMGWNLLQPYLADFKGLSYAKQRDAVKDSWFMVVGFAMPFVLLSSVPFVGIYSLAFAQAGAAHLVLEMRKRAGESRTDK